jgi:hypothetical protein
LGAVLQILSATRIHNRHLRTQFAQHQEAGPEDFQTLFVCDAAGKLQTACRML